MPSKRASSLAPNPTITPRTPNTTLALFRTPHTRTHNTPIESFLTHHDLTLRAVFDAFDEIETSLSSHEFFTSATLDAGSTAPALSAQTVYIIDTVMGSLLQAGGGVAGIEWMDMLRCAGASEGDMRRRSTDQEWGQNLKPPKSGRRYRCCSRTAKEPTPYPHEGALPTVTEVLAHLAQELFLAVDDLANPSDPSPSRLQKAQERELHIREKKARNKKAKKQRVREQKARDQERREKEAREQDRVAQDFWQAPAGGSAVGVAAVGFERMVNAHVRLQRTVDAVQEAMRRMWRERAVGAKKMREEREGWEEERRGVEVAQARAQRNGQRVARLRREQEYRSWSILTKLEWGGLSDDEI